VVVAAVGSDAVGSAAWATYLAAHPGPRSISGASGATSLRLPPVTVQASGIPPALTSREGASSESPPLLNEVRQRAPEGCDESLVLERDPRSRRAASQTPMSGVEAQRSDRVPLGRWDARQVDRLAVAPA
jgi:hypothetical protein